MTKELIAGLVDEIRESSGDDEVAHSMEDDLYYSFVHFVAESAPEPYSEMARELEKVRDIEFCRWHA